MVITEGKDESLRLWAILYLKWDQGAVQASSIQEPLETLLVWVKMIFELYHKGCILLVWMPYYSEY